MYSILKEIVDSAGNVGYVFDQSFIGDDAGVIEKIAELFAADGIPRFAQIQEGPLVRTIQ